MVAFILQYLLPGLAVAGGVAALIYLPAPANRWALMALFGLALMSTGFGAGYRLATKACAAKEAARERAILSARIAEQARQAQATASLARDDRMREDMIAAARRAADAAIDRSEDNATAPGQGNSAGPVRPCAGDRGHVIDREFVDRLRQQRDARRRKAGHS